MLKLLGVKWGNHRHRQNQQWGYNQQEGQRKKHLPVRSKLPRRKRLPKIPGAHQNLLKAEKKRTVPPPHQVVPKKAVQQPNKVFQLGIALGKMSRNNHKQLQKRLHKKNPWQPMQLHHQTIQQSHPCPSIKTAVKKSLILILRLANLPVKKKMWFYAKCWRQRW